MLRKYGTDASQQVTEVEPTGEAEKIDKTAAAQEWTPEDERDLQEETRDRPRG